MTNNVKDFSNRTTFDGSIPNDDQMIVPMLLEFGLLEQLYKKGYKNFQIETFHLFHNKTVKVAFTVIEKKNYESYMKMFNSQITDYLKNTLDAKSQFEVELFNETGQPVLSLDKIIENVNSPDRNSHDPTGSSIYDKAFIYEQMLKDLIDSLPDSTSKQVISMIESGYLRKEIIEQTSLSSKGKTQAYDEINKIIKEAEKLIKEKFIK